MLDQKKKLFQLFYILQINSKSPQFAMAFREQQESAKPSRLPDSESGLMIFQIGLELWANAI